MPSSKLGGRKMLSSLALPQKLVPPMKLEIFKTTIPWSDGSGMASPSHSMMTLFSRFLYVLEKNKDRGLVYYDEQLLSTTYIGP
jgi:hypothetical protein